MKAEEIRAARLKLNLTQAELGELFGVSGNSIARWERGEREPDAKGMMVLAFEMLLTRQAMLEVANKKLLESKSLLGDLLDTERKTRRIGSGQKKKAK
ncbi:MAG TPA: helix-turn-helix domain-containing protein [Blastocatellia bacterium]|nr:helix-turn-helix domain-containing protein [Blastocatellia bacterium]